jgi:signal transduction histidine kinase
VRSVTHDGRRLLERLLNSVSAEVRIFGQTASNNSPADAALISLLREIERLVDLADQFLKLLRQKYDRSDPERDILGFFRDGILKTSEEIVSATRSLLSAAEAGGDVQRTIRASALRSLAFEFNSFAKKVMIIGESISKSKTERVRLKTEIKKIVQDLNGKYAHVYWEYTDQTISSIRANRAVIYLVFRELISNAIKYRDLQRTLHLTITERRDAGGTLVITVADNGIGIPRDDCLNNRIFTSFWRSSNAKQLDDSRHENEGSQGLGLAIVQLAVAYLDGQVSVESELHTGTTFRIALPG